MFVALETLVCGKKLSNLLQGYEGSAYSKFNPGLDKISTHEQKIARVHDMKH